MPLEHKPLPYPSDALEPHIDKQTMEIHHGRHYKTYVDNYNKALAEQPDLDGRPLEEVLANNCEIVKEKIKTTVRNHGGGAHNHALFWDILGPGAIGNQDFGGHPIGDVAQAIDSAFGSFDSFKERFNTVAVTLFGSGWAWLVMRGRKLEVISTPNQDSPLMAGACPIIGLDVWEHAYYLKYRYRRVDYIKAWWNVVNWQAAEERYKGAK